MLRLRTSAEVIDDVRSVTFDGGNVLASGGPDGRVILWDIGGDKVTMRPPHEYVDEESRQNIETFWRLGYA